MKYKKIKKRVDLWRGGSWGSLLTGHRSAASYKLVRQEITSDIIAFRLSVNEI